MLAVSYFKWLNNIHSHKGGARKIWSCYYLKLIEIVLVRGSSDGEKYQKKQQEQMVFKIT